MASHPHMKLKVFPYFLTVRLKRKVIISCNCFIYLACSSWRNKNIVINSMLYSRRFWCSLHQRYGAFCQYNDSWDQSSPRERGAPVHDHRGNECVCALSPAGVVHPLLVPGVCKLRLHKRLDKFRTYCLDFSSSVYLFHHIHYTYITRTFDSHNSNLQGK